MNNTAVEVWQFGLLVAVLACSGTTTVRAPSPIPGPTQPSIESTSKNAPAGGWSFHYTRGPSRYRATRIAAIEAPSDSGIHHEISTNTTYELIDLESGSSPDTILVTVVADSFATTTQGRIGSVQSVQLPVKISAILTESGMAVDGQTQTAKCDPIASALASDLRNLLPVLPTQLTPGMSWSDSIQTGGCQAGIPTVLNLRRVFVVSGETTGQGQAMLVVLRIDTVTARGEGSQLQHRVALQAEGTGNATYFLDPTTGKIARLTSRQDLHLTFTASAQTTRFHETSQQEFVLLR